MTQTEQELDELVKRLEDVWTRFEGRRHGHINPDGPEAIAAIQSLRAELSSAKATIERLKGVVKTRNKKIQRLKNMRDQWKEIAKHGY